MELSGQKGRPQGWQDKLYLAAARNQKLAHLVFNLFYLYLAGVIAITFYAGFTEQFQEIFNFFQVNRANFARTALVVLVIILTPGILGRFGIEIKVSRIITLYRRRLGISFFMISLVHAHLIILPRLTGLEPFTFPFPLFQIMGTFALTIALPLFLTSNNFSVRKLGRWWKRIHRFVYVVLFFALLHTALQRVSIWSILAGIWVVLELTSFTYAYIKGGSFFNKPRPKITN